MRNKGRKIKRIIMSTPKRFDYDAFVDEVNKAAEEGFRPAWSTYRAWNWHNSNKNAHYYSIELYVEKEVETAK